MSAFSEVSFVRCDPSGRGREGASAVIRDGKLPLLLWRDVRVTRRRRQGISRLERIILEMARDLKKFTTRDIEEITSLPADAVAPIAGRMENLGLLRQDETGNWSGNQAQVAEAIEQNPFWEEYRDLLTFLYLPATDDLLSFDARSGASAPSLGKATPCCLYPLPAPWRGKSRLALLQEKMKKGSVINAAQDIVDIPSEAVDSLLPETCSAYLFNGEIRQAEGAERITITLFSPPGSGGAERADIIINLTGARGFSRFCAEGLEAVKELGPKAAWKSLMPEGTDCASAEATTPTLWTYAVDKQTAERLAVGRRLTEATAAAAIWREQVPFEIRIILRPVGTAAARLFAIDRVIDRLHEKERWAPEELAAIVRAAHADYRASCPASADWTALLRRRLWKLAEYRMLYQLRARGDFHYD